MVKFDTAGSQNNAPKISKKPGRHHKGYTDNPCKPATDERWQIHGHDVQLDNTLGIIQIMPRHFRHAEWRCRHDKAHHGIADRSAADGHPDQRVGENFFHWPAAAARVSSPYQLTLRPITQPQYYKRCKLDSRQRKPACEKRMICSRPTA